MTEYHTIYKGPEGESTKWDDIQRKLGNKAPKVGRRRPASGTRQPSMAAAAAAAPVTGCRQEPRMADVAAP